MRRVYKSNDIDDLGQFLAADHDIAEKTRKISEFYEKHVAENIKNDANEYVGKLLLRLFLAINCIVIGIVVVYAILDIAYHIENAENRFIDGSVLGGLVTATIAQAVAAYVAFTGLINK